MTRIRVFVGTDATIHEHIKTLLTREYMNKEGPKGDQFCPSVLGMALIDAYDNMDIDLPLSKPFLRGQVRFFMKFIAFDIVFDDLKHA